VFAIENVMHTLIPLQVRWYICVCVCDFPFKKSIQYVQNQRKHLSIDLELEMIVYIIFKVDHFLCFYYNSIFTK
jgi:hypothetical protein